MPEMSRKDLVEEVNKLMALNENELYAILGYQSLGLDEKATELRLSDSFSITKSDLVIRGSDFFENHKQQLKKSICDDWQYCKKRSEYGGDFKLLVGALIPTIITGPAPLITVLCALAFKYGLDRLCEC